MVGSQSLAFGMRQELGPRYTVLCGGLVLAGLSDAALARQPALPNRTRANPGQSLKNKVEPLLDANMAVQFKLTYWPLGSCGLYRLFLSPAYSLPHAAGLRYRRLFSVRSPFFNLHQPHPFPAISTRKTPCLAPWTTTNATGTLSVCSRPNSGPARLHFNTNQQQSTRRTNAGSRSGPGSASWRPRSPATGATSTGRFCTISRRR